MARSSVTPRDVPPVTAAVRLGLSLDDFEQKLPDLIARGFPTPDATTAFFDLKAIEAWMDRRSGLAGMSVPAAKDAASVVAERVARMAGGKAA